MKTIREKTSVKKEIWGVIILVVSHSNRFLFADLASLTE